MKNTKKGFTLVELLVVIAIVAILATVAIIGYTSFTRKADISNDTVIAKELTTLIQATDINDPVENFDDVMSVLYANGFYLANLNTKTEGCFFVWESKNNQILLVDAKNGFEVLFPESYEPKGATWHLICSDKDLVAGLDVADISVQYAVVSSDSLNELIAAGTDKIYVDEGFAIAEGSAIDFTGKDNVTLVLGESSLSTNGTINGAPIHVENSTLTVEGGTLNASGNFTNQHGTFSCAIGYDGGTKLNVKDVNFIGITGINGTMNRDGHVELVVENSTFNVTSGGVILSTGSGNNSTAVVNNCTINAGRYALFTSQQGTITVNGGTYKGGVAAISSQDAGTKVIVNSGTFDGAISVTNGAALEINAGTFVNTGLTLEQFSAYVTAGKTVTEDNGAFIVK